MSPADPFRAFAHRIDDWQSTRRQALTHTPTLPPATAQALGTAAKEIGQKKPTHLALPGSPEAGENFHERLLGALSQRQQLIASNIANADTPQYQATDLQLDEVIRTLTDSTASPLALRNSAPGHFTPAPLKGMERLAPMYYTPHQPSADGNTVDMDAERSKLAENSVRYHFSLERANEDYSDMLSLLRDLR